MKQITIGIDIGGTYTKYGLVDESGTPLVDGSMPTTGYDKIEGFAEALQHNVSQLIDDSVKVQAVGIGAPNANYFKGTIEHAPNLAWKGIVHVVDIFKQYFNLPVFITNDAKAAAIGEQMFGNAKGMTDFLVITLGTGLGSGLFVGGEPIYGHDGFAGELGHIEAITNGRQCNCGRTGCLETYASATGIKRTVFELLSKTTHPSSLREFTYNELDGRHIAEAAHAGDPVALEAFQFTGHILGKKLADAVAFTSPEAIFLFGGLINAGDLILRPTCDSFEKNLFSNYKGKIRVLPSGLSGTNAAVLGASALAWKEIRK